MEFTKKIKTTASIEDLSGRPEDSELVKHETSSQRPKMRFFRSSKTDIGEKVQRVKRYSREHIDQEVSKEGLRENKSSWKYAKKCSFKWWSSLCLAQTLTYLPNQIRSNMKCLKQMCASFEHCNLSDDNVPNLKKLMLTNKPAQIEKLHLFFSESSFNSKHGISLLVTCIGNNFKNLKELTIYFEYSPRIPVEGYEALGIQLENNFKQLQQLNLKFRPSTLPANWKKTCLSEENLSNLFKPIKNNISQLWRLELNCDKNWLIGDRGISNLAMQLGSKFQQLRHLQLSFGSCPKITDQGLATLARQIGCKLKNLQHLALNFCCITREFSLGISKKGLSILGLQLRNNLPNLKSLEVKSSCETIYPKGPFSLSSGKREGQIADEEISAFVTHISKNQKLQHLTLELVDCSKLRNETIKFLATEIGNNLKQLRQLSFMFFNYAEFSDEELSSLAKSIGNNLLNLEHLKLEFLGSDSKVTDNGVTQLATHLETLKSLRSLSLNLKCSPKVTNQGLSILVNLIQRHLKKLDQLDLNFYGCPGITAEGVEIIRSPFRKKWKAFERLNLSLNYYSLRKIGSEMSEGGVPEGMGYF